MIGNLIEFGITFILLSVTFAPLEKRFPARTNQRVFRPEWITDCTYFIGQYLFWSGSSIALLSLFQTQIQSSLPTRFIELAQSQPWWLQALEAIVLGDLSLYWFHRFQHAVPLLWKFHSIHHSAEHLDWLAGHREHPLDGLIMQLAANAPAMILGFPLATIGVVIGFRGVWAAFIHANVRIPVGPLKFLIGAPELHHWHHAKQRTSCNFANLCPMIDVVFGTYNCPPDEPPGFGIDEKMPTGYLQQLLYPFRSR